MAVSTHPRTDPLRTGHPTQPSAPPTHGLTVIGWLLVCFAAGPLAMGAAGDGGAWGWGGLAMLAVGLACVQVGRRLRPRSGGA